MGRTRQVPPREGLSSPATWGQYHRQRGPCLLADRGRPWCRGERGRGKWRGGGGHSECGSKMLGKKDSDETVIYQNRFCLRSRVISLPVEDCWDHHMGVFIPPLPLLTQRKSISEKLHVSCSHLTTFSLSRMYVCICRAQDVDGKGI